MADTRRTLDGSYTTIAKPGKPNFLNFGVANGKDIAPSVLLRNCNAKASPGHCSSNWAAITLSCASTSPCIASPFASKSASFEFNAMPRGVGQPRSA